MITFCFAGPGNFQPRVMSHGVAVYREGATLTPAPPAHGAQPNTVIHQITGKPQDSRTIFMIFFCILLGSQVSLCISFSASDKITCKTSDSLSNFRKNTKILLLILYYFRTVPAMILMKFTKTDNDPHKSPCRDYLQAITYVQANK